MSAADFAHHDDALTAAHRSGHTAAPSYRSSATPSLPHVTSDELRASRGELLAALNDARVKAIEAIDLADVLFNALKGRHLTTTTEGDITQ